MTRRSSEPLIGWFAVWDLALAAAAWMAAYGLRFQSGFVPIYREVPEISLYLANLPLVVLFAAIMFRVAGLYQVHRLIRVREEFVVVGKAVVLLAIAMMALSFARQAQYESRAAMVIFPIVAFVFIFTFRRVTWSILGRLRASGVNQSHAIIVGTGRLARQSVRALRHASWTGIQPVACVEDAPVRPLIDVPYAGRIEDLPRLVEECHAEHVFIALPMVRYADVRRVFDVLSQSIVEVRLIADTPAIAGLSLSATSLHGMTIIGLRESGHFGLNVFVKRIMDIVFSTIALVVLAIPFAIIAWLIKRSSPGPVFYRQERCSINGQPFQMLKFRTMPVDAEAKTGPVWTAENDPRRTKLGAFLRATNIDELPQLVNVLKGEMSLVGPRPERPHFVNQFRKSIPNYQARHAVKAGITGWAQVNGWRGNSSLRRRVQFDLYYITHWNPLFDLRIMVMTVLRTIFKKQKHAY
jgi:Undecaprenyl-phosphate glucose phosphotransferase